MANGKLFTDDERATIRAMHAEGASATKIGKQLGRPVNSITRIAAGMGLRFDHTKTALATRAHAIDMRARRVEAAQRVLDEAMDCLDGLKQPYIDHAFAPGGDPETRFTEHEAMPTPGDKANLARAASTLLAEHRRLAQFDASTETESVKGLLTALFDGLQDRYGNGDTSDT